MKDSLKDVIQEAARDAVKDLLKENHSRKAASVDNILQGLKPRD